MRTWDEIDRNYIETFKYRIKILFEDYYHDAVVKKFFEEMESVQRKSFNQCFQMYLWLLELLNKYRRRFFDGTVKGRVENFLMYELMMQSEARWKAYQKVSKEIDVITLSIAQMNKVLVPNINAELAPVVQPKASMSEVLLTPGISFGMGVLFACIATAVVIALPVSWPFMVGAIVGAAVIGIVMGFGAKKIVDYSSGPSKEKSAELAPAVNPRPRGISDVYKMFLDFDRKLTASSPPQSTAPSRGLSAESSVFKPLDPVDSPREEVDTEYSWRQTPSARAST